jgi:hypothetical protein
VLGSAVTIPNWNPDRTFRQPFRRRVGLMY